MGEGQYNGTRHTQRTTASSPRKGQGYQMEIAHQPTSGWPLSGQSHSSFPQGTYNSVLADPTTTASNGGSPQLASYSSPYSNPSSGSFSSPSPPYNNPAFTDQGSRGLQGSRNAGGDCSGTPFLGPSTSSSSHPPAASGREDWDNELQRLRKRVNELELVNEHARNRIRSLETEIAHDVYGGGQQQQQQQSSPFLPSAPVPHHPHTGDGTSFSPQPSHMQASWRARTASRVRMFCSLNRAGNALCSWHDSRRLVTDIFPHMIFGVLTV
jgi:hypothetical protein